MQTPKDVHNVNSAAEYLAWFRKFLAGKRAAGASVVEFESSVQLVAYVNHGRWIVDCECGAGNSVDPSWSVACCVGCGAIHRDLVFPADVSAVETCLTQRAFHVNRNFDPRRGEDVATIRRENTSRGLRDR